MNKFRNFCPACEKTGTISIKKIDKNGDTDVFIICEQEKGGCGHILICNEKEDDAIEELNELIQIFEEYKLYEGHAKLKPCPFCGSVDAPKIVFEGATGITQIVCSSTNDGCGTSGPLCYSTKSAIEHWNERTL